MIIIIIEKDNITMHCDRRDDMISRVQRVSFIALAGMRTVHSQVVYTTVAVQCTHSCSAVIYSAVDLIKSEPFARVVVQLYTIVLSEKDRCGGAQGVCLRVKTLGKP